MLVEPAYKANWEIPGGAVEADESPRECVIREVHEELGIVVEPSRLLVIDYQHPEPQRTESLMFIFDGGVLDDDERRGLSLADDELSSYAFVEPAELGSLTSPRLARRIQHAPGRRVIGRARVPRERPRAGMPASRTATIAGGIRSRAPGPEFTQPWTRPSG
jgi:8-oxo-dGTP diphosphatase